MSHDLAQVNNHVKACICVFVSLLVLTAFTVLASYLHMPTPAAITLALIIASIKATLVLTYFMHLIDEKWLVYFTLVLTSVFFIVLLGLPILSKIDVIQMLVERIY